MHRRISGRTFHYFITYFITLGRKEDAEVTANGLRSAGVRARILPSKARGQAAHTVWTDPRVLDKRGRAYLSHIDCWV